MRFALQLGNSTLCFTFNLQTFRTVLNAGNQLTRTFFKLTDCLVEFSLEQRLSLPFPGVSILLKRRKLFSYRSSLFLERHAKVRRFF